jgi:hypothetical protein
LVVTPLSSRNTKRSAGSALICWRYVSRSAAISGRSCSAARSVFFHRQLETLERPAHHRTADSLAGDREQALRILIQVGIVGLSHEPLQQRQIMGSEPTGRPAAVRLGAAPALLAGLADPIADSGGAHAKAAGNGDLTPLSLLVGDQNALAQISGIGLGQVLSQLGNRDEKAAGGS